MAIDAYIDKNPHVIALEMCKKQSLAEAYHAGERGQTLGFIGKGYLAAKYPLIEEYQKWRGGE